MRRAVVVVSVLLAAVSVSACGDESESSPSSAAATSSVPAATSTSAGPASTPPTSAGPASTTSTSAGPASTPPTSVVGLEQPAIWPAAGVVFATPEEAAADFVTNALGVEPTLGEFRQGDLRSGEIEVLFPGEGDGGGAFPRSLLLLRQLAPDDGWFVIAAVNDNASITTPNAAAEVPAGDVTVEGVARGFEATIHVTAFVAGDAGTELDQAIAMGGALETPEPFSAVLDLSAAAPGTVVAILVAGDTGLESDPGEFSARSVVITG